MIDKLKKYLLDWNMRALERKWAVSDLSTADQQTYENMKNYRKRHYPVRDS